MMLILEIRQCSLCGKKYQIGAVERKMMEENPHFAPVHEECLEAIKKLPPAELLALIQRETDASKTKWRE